MIRRKLAAIMVLTAAAVVLGGVLLLLGEPKAVTRVAFGSCNNTHYGQPVWRAVLDARPDVWIWAGDNIYADSEDVGRHRRMYQQQKDHPMYAQLQRQVLVTGTWDDHDYGANNAGKEYPSKAESQQALLDFLDVPAADPRRSREGVYTSHILGPAGKRLRIILLDTRYHRDAFGSDGDVLGDAQWEWLDREIADPDSDLILLVSSVAVLMDGPATAEGWHLFPKSRQRLLSTISRATAPVIILSGDRHFAEISRVELTEARWPIIEVMSSGLTHAAGGMRYANPNRVGYAYSALNFGFLDIDWGLRDTDVQLQIRGAEGQSRIKTRVQYSWGLSD